MTFHHADGIVRGMAPGGIVNLVVVLVLVAWLYGTLVDVRERPAGSPRSERQAKPARHSRLDG